MVGASSRVSSECGAEAARHLNRTLEQVDRLGARGSSHTNNFALDPLPIPGHSGNYQLNITQL